MANKYLTKIAGMEAVGRAAASIVGAVGKSVGNGVRSFGRAAGKQIHLSTGGGFSDHAMNSFGVDKARKLMKFDGSEDGIKNLLKEHQARRATSGVFGKGFENTFKNNKVLDEKFMKDTIQPLQRQQTRARIVVGGSAVGAAALAIKAKNKMNEPKVDTYYQQY